MIHLLVRGLGFCGASGVLESTRIPRDVTCPSCRFLIERLREEDRGTDTPIPSILLANTRRKRG